MKLFNKKIWNEMAGEEGGWDDKYGNGFPPLVNKIAQGIVIAYLVILAGVFIYYGILN